MDDEIYNRALNLTYFYLKFRPRTEKETIAYLTKKSQKYNFDQLVIEKVITDLKEQNLINDKQFIIWFVDQRNSSKPKGRFALTAELLRLGIDKDLLNQYFEESPQDEDALAYQALSRRFEKWRNLAQEKRFQKAAAFLSRRGFRFEEIRKAITKLENL